MANLAEYGQDVMKEMRKVSWPKREELVANTAITLVASLMRAFFIFGMDRIISAVLQLVYGT